VIGFVFAVLFTWAAYLQYNDPDALMWYAIYGAMALASILFAFDRLNFLFTVVLSLAYLVGTFLLWPEKFEGFTIGEGDILNIERAREACGLLIAAIVLIVYAIRIKTAKKSKI
ncbi:MAG: hypothetical protein HKN31_02930, partial [Pricia sp.]|nr:hypothetical protein [Pricia sp.]